MYVSRWILFVPSLPRLITKALTPALPARRCLTDLADECAVNNGGCWQGQYTAKGSKQTFSACKDQIHAVKARWIYCHLPVSGDMLDGTSLRLR